MQVLCQLILITLTDYLAPGQLDGFRQFRIDNQVIKPKSWHYVSKHYEIEPFFADVELRIHRFSEQLRIAFIPFVVEISGRSVGEATHSANALFDKFRALLNLTYSFGVYQRRWGGYPIPLGKIFYPPVYGVFDSSKKYLELYYNLTKYDQYERNQITQAQVKQARKLANKIYTPAKEDSTLLLLRVALEKYGEALDTNEWRLSFLLFWQILELLSLQKPQQLNMKEAINRIAGFLDNDQTARDLLIAIYNTRNELVHQGYFPDERGLNEVSLLKMIVERCINKLFARLRVLSNKSRLLRYFEYQVSNDAELSERLRIIKVINTSRKKQKGIYVA